jgi:hypothetical protein
VGQQEQKEAGERSRQISIAWGKPAAQVRDAPTCQSNSKIPHPAIRSLQVTHCCSERNSRSKKLVASCFSAPTRLLCAAQGPEWQPYPHLASVSHAPHHSFRGSVSIPPLLASWNSAGKSVALDFWIPDFVVCEDPTQGPSEERPLAELWKTFPLTDRLIFNHLQLMIVPTHSPLPRWPATVLDTIDSSMQSISRRPGLGRAHPKRKDQHQTANLHLRCALSRTL